MAYSGKRKQLSLKRRQSLQPQAIVASMIGVSQATYSNIENGYTKPNDEQAKALIEMFDLPDDYFNGGDDDGKPNREPACATLPRRTEIRA